VELWAAGQEHAAPRRPSAPRALSDREYTGLSPGTAYTVALGASPGLGVSHQALLRGVRLAREAGDPRRLVGVGPV
jgi:hypothetical protein